MENMIPKFGGRLKLIRLSKNTGAAATPRNVGTSLAIGKYLYFMDSDDMLTENALEIFYTAAETYKADVVCNRGHYLIHTDGKITLHDDFKRKTPLFRPYDVVQRVRDFAFKWRYGVAPWRKFVRRDFFVENNISFPPAFVFDDTSVSFQYDICAKVFVVIPETTYYWRLRKTSSTQLRFAMVGVFDKQIKLISAVFQALNKFIDRTKFFTEFSPGQFIINGVFFRHFLQGSGMHYIQKYYTSAPIGVIYKVKNELLSDGKVFDDHWIAYVLAAANFQSDQLREGERQIEQLKLELKALRGD